MDRIIEKKNGVKCIDFVGKNGFARTCTHIVVKFSKI